MSTHVVLRLYLGQLVGWLVNVTIQKPCCNQWWTVQVLTIRWLDESAASVGLSARRAGSIQQSDKQDTNFTHISSIYDHNARSP